MARSRCWSAPLRIAVVAAALTVASCSSPDRTEHRGSFDIEYRRVDAFGHVATRQTLYHLKAQRRTLVANSGAYVIPTADPDRVIYYTCDASSGAAVGTDDSPECAHVYYDGHTETRHVIGRRLAVTMSQLDDRQTDPSRISRWAKDFVVLGDQYEFVLLDLTSGASTNLTETLGLEPPRYPENWQHREARWGGWSPDGTHAAIIVMAPAGPGVPVLDWQEELYSLEGATGTLAHIATHVGRLGGGPGSALWKARDLQWDGGDLRPPL